MAINVKNRTIFCHDNLDILKGINSNCVDLIYLDPPFNKNKKFTAPIGSSAEGAEFSDIFREEDIKDEWLETIKEDRDDIYSFLAGIKHYGNKYNFCYLAYMAIRLIECHRLLKETGSLYLHCDQTMCHYLKILLDCVFGEKSFRNEIVWHYDIGGRSKTEFAKKHDILLVYAKDKNKYKFYDKYIRIPYKTQVKGRKTPLISPEKYAKGKIPTNVWTDIPVNLMMKERTGYPTQKPIALLERIIKASSPKNGFVLDPFCGCATTCIAAEKLGRQWIGIDISIRAYDLVKIRLEKEVKGLEEIKQETGEIKTQTNVFKRDLEVFAETKPPKRTDRRKEAQNGKYVYVISHKKYKGWYKVGIANNVNSRLNSYQTSDPNRAFKIEFHIRKEKYRECEKHIHATFENQFEWVKGDVKKITEEIKKFSA